MIYTQSERVSSNGSSTYLEEIIGTPSFLHDYTNLQLSYSLKGNYVCFPFVLAQFRAKIHEHIGSQSTKISTHWKSKVNVTSNKIPLRILQVCIYHVDSLAFMGVYVVRYRDDIPYVQTGSREWALTVAHKHS